jgi:WhiB family redox-sensing transcriptional regulator
MNTPGAICAECCVREPCLDWAIKTRTDHGIFGGLDPRQRRKLRRQLTLVESDHNRVDTIRLRGTAL